MEDSIGLGLLPYSVPGTDPGSTYRVVVRTAEHYIAVRRLSEHIYRIRLARVDNGPLNIKGTTPELWAQNFNFSIGKDWTHMSSRAFNLRAAHSIISRLVHVILISDETIESLKNEDTEEGQALQKAVDNAQQATNETVEVTEPDNDNSGGKLN